VARVRCLRGVCIGVERHLVPGEITDVDSPQFLISIGAVELVQDEPGTESDSKSPAKAGKAKE